MPDSARHAQDYVLDPSAKPKSIDWRDGGKNGPSKPLAGIYELEGDELKICWGKEGAGRPEAFATAPGTGEWLWVMNRAKKK